MLATTAYERFSEKNGVISIKINGGRTEVLVGGAKQTSATYYQLWDKAWKYLNPRLPLHSVTNVLMLGLAGGGALPSIHSAFPHAIVSVVEHDPEMIAIARDIQPQTPFPFPIVYEGDAAHIVPTLSTVFDIILVDLFDGIEPSPLLRDHQFIAGIKKILASNGTVIVNVCLQAEYLEVFETFFTHVQKWRYKMYHPNIFGAFWNQK